MYVRLKNSLFSRDGRVVCHNWKTSKVEMTLFYQLNSPVDNRPKLKVPNNFFFSNFVK